MDLRERAASATNRHPWELVRADFFERLLADHDLLDARRWLDVGAGDAWFATELVGRLPVDATRHVLGHQLHERGPRRARS